MDRVTNHAVQALGHQSLTGGSGADQPLQRRPEPEEAVVVELPRADDRNQPTETEERPATPPSPALETPQRRPDRLPPLDQRQEQQTRHQDVERTLASRSEPAVDPRLERTPREDDPRDGSVRNVEWTDRRIVP
jgi:hypothetical protein